MTFPVRIFFSITKTVMNPIFTEINRRAPRLPDEPLRLFHGRGQTIPGYEFLTIDWYPPAIFVTLYEKREQSWIEQLGKALQSVFTDRLKGIVVQTRGEGRDGSRLIYGSLPEPCIIRENGLRYRIDLLAGQNIGFFPDMKTGRQLVREIAVDRKVLNLFAYTCSLSVAAIAGGAVQVVNLDMNRNLLDRGRENHQLNAQDLRRVSFMSYNLFKSFGRLRQIGPFDLIIIDPPYRQGDSFKAERDWPKIIRRLPELLAPNGEVVAAVSAPELGRDFLRNRFNHCLPEAELLVELSAGEDFPEADPVKGLHLQHYRLKHACPLSSSND